MARITKEKMLKWALKMKKGGMIAFTNKKNGVSMAGLLRTLGYKIKGIRSTGKTVDAKGITEDAYVIVITGGSNRWVKVKKPKRKRRNTNPFGVL